MAKKAKEEKTIDIFNLKIEEPKQVSKNKKPKASKKDVKHKDNKPKDKKENEKKGKSKAKSKNKQKKKEQPKNDKFDLDNEIVIGLTPLKDNKKKKKANQKNKENKKDKPEKKHKNKNSTKTAKIIKWTILIMCLIGAIIFFMLSPLFNIVEIKVEGNSKVSKEQIISLSGIQIGQNTFKIVKSNVKQNVKQNAYIEDVETKRNLPNIVTIKVEERTPTFMLEFSSAYVYINNQGYILEINEEKIDVPIIIGYKTTAENIIPGNRLCIEDLEKLETVLKIVESANSIEILNLITKIDITNKQEYKLILEEEQKKVYLGDASEISTKLLYVKQIVAREKDNPGEIFANGDMSKGRVYFREE